MQPRRRYIVFIKNGFDRALRDTGFTVDAFIGMDVDHFGILIKAIGWANLQASLVFTAFARFSHYHRHNGDPPVRIVDNRVGTGGGENLDDKADIKLQEISDAHLTNRASRELVEMWRSGSEDAARVLLARYEVRLVALVASRLNRKYRDGIAPEDVVQSAMGSFFQVTRAGANPSLKLESTASAWNILATFVRRKLARALERETAVKRGGGRTRVSLDDLDPDVRSNPSATEADELLADIHLLLNSDQSQLLELVHGDLTPNNILLDNDGRIVVTDFGFSTYSQNPTSVGGAFESIVAAGGTLGFAAPEQISPAFGTIGFTTDIYAIGGLAFYLLTGQSPHDSSSLLDTVADEDLILPNAPVTLAEAKLVAVAKFALKKAITSRPSSVTELVPLLVD